MGFWIFASVCVICLVFLYTKTKNEWNWKKIILWLVGIVITAIAAFILVLSWDSIFSSDANQNYKGYLSSYKDIKIGSKLSDVQFKYGPLKQEQKSNGDTFDLYTIGNDAGIYVRADKKVDAIVVFCENGNQDKFNGISCGDPSEKLEKKFGADLKILCTVKDKNGWEEVGNVSRAYDVAKYGTRYVLRQNKVVFIGIMQKEDFEKDPKKWGVCD